MSEEILKAFAQLFAYATMQDGGTTDNERTFVTKYFNKIVAFDVAPIYLDLYRRTSEKISSKSKRDKKDEGQDANKEVDFKSLTQDQKDKIFQRLSIRLLGVCRKINKTLSIDQKVLVIVKMVELIACDADGQIGEKRMEVIATAFAELQIGTKEEFQEISDFVILSPNEIFPNPNTLTVKQGFVDKEINDKAVSVVRLDGSVIFLRVAQADMYFVKYTGKENCKLDDFIMEQNAIYQYSRGSILRTQHGNSYYFSDLTSAFVAKGERRKLSFNALNLEFKFKNGHVGLIDVSVSESGGKLIGIMGASGAGKTTLLNVLAGIEIPSKGNVEVNGINIHTDQENAQGIIGYVAQDDLLIEELSVYQNLFYNTKLCFKSLSESELDERVMKSLTDLGLDHIKDLKVGNALSKTISGGQRKRLNIALELIREPVVLFLDEPTSGLSSRDSENVLDLLKELSFKGKLIFVVIHQPSSEIFKMFDKLMILDTGGYQAYYGNPVDAVIYFKTETKQAKATEGQCFNCGNVNPEQIFDILEDRVVSEKGEYTNNRKIKPIEWNEKFKSNENQQKEIQEVATETEKPPKALDLPSVFKQAVVFTTRDFLSKISNKQYIIINLIQAPLLAFLLAYIIRFQNGPDGSYLYRFNDNIPAYILIAVLVALFMGLTVSAEEIIKDRKIQKREAFLNLSRHAYFFSKLTILFSLSALQTLLFVVVGNLILGVNGMNLTYWFVLFSVSCYANVLGLNISSTFNSVVTVYITIPLIIIPQMILSGIIFNFNKLNNNVSDKGQVPLIADFMVSRWGFEAIAVDQFKNNSYMKPYYKFEKEKSIATYRRDFWLDQLKNATVRSLNYTKKRTDSTDKLLAKDLKLISKELISERQSDKKYLVAQKIRPALKKFRFLPLKLNPKTFNKDQANMLFEYYDSLVVYYRKRYNLSNKIVQKIQDKNETLTEDLNDYHNESLEDFMTAANVADKTIIFKNRVLQQVDPVFFDPTDFHENKIAGFLNYRSHFLAPRKHVFGTYIDTYLFNILVLWLFTITLYFTLYFNLFRKFFDSIGNIKFKKNKTIKKDMKKENTPKEKKN